MLELPKQTVITKRYISFMPIRIRWLGITRMPLAPRILRRCLRFILLVSLPVLFLVLAAMDASSASATSRSKSELSSLNKTPRKTHSRSHRKYSTRAAAHRSRRHSARRRRRSASSSPPAAKSSRHTAPALNTPNGPRLSAKSSARLAKQPAPPPSHHRIAPADPENGALVPAALRRRTTRHSPQQRIAQQKPVQTGAIEGTVLGPDGKGVSGAKISLRNLATGQKIEKTTDADGVFRLIDLPPARYELDVQSDGFEPFSGPALQLAAGQVLDREIRLKPVAFQPPKLQQIPEVTQLKLPAAAPPVPPMPPLPPYSGVLQSIEQSQPPATPPVPPLPPASEVFRQEPDRWNVAMPDWDRYGVGGERPYVKSHRLDPYDRNKWKGDYPIIGNRTFFDFTAQSDTFFDGRRLPTPSDVSTARPGSSEFFGKGEQVFLDQTFLFSFDLFHGDTSFRPADWRIRVTPVVSLNYLAVQENGVVNINPAKGTTRLDSHIGLQEAFAELKLADLSPNFDFLSVRAGIQQFNSDFRGFMFVEQQPGFRLFGNYDDNRWQYNMAYFNLLEKDTNSNLNSLKLRNQQVIIANVYRQDFLFPGYTAQFSVHYNIDQASVHYDDNGFLVRPAPVGGVVSNGRIQTHSIHAVYLGWTGDGHIGRVNVTNAFYQAFGNDSFNGIAQRPVTINAQFAAVELSVDKDWARFKVSSMYASGSADPRSGRARGFDSIDDSPEFMGGIFSLWNREGIRLTGTGIQLTPENSILPDLRSNKFEGQSNFVNPGIFLVNSGATFDLSPKLRSFVNLSYLQFMRTEPLEILLFQENIHRSIGYDYNIGFRYRPPLTENIVLTAGAAGLTPGDGLHDIFGGRTLFSLFADVRLQF